MDIRAATDHLTRRCASMTLSTPVSRGHSRLATQSRHTIRISTCQSSRSYSSTPRLRREQSAKDSATPPSYTDEIYKRRTTFLDELAPRPSSALSGRTLSQRPSQASPRPNQSSTSDPPARPRTSLDDMLTEARSPSTSSSAPRETFSNWGSPQRRNPFLTPRDSSSSFPSLNLPSNLSPSKPRAPTPRPRVVRELDIHVKPRSGRSLAVDPEQPTDLGAKLRSLDALLARNRIKQMHRMQKFHERPGLKRKRLRQVRWRRQFRKMFDGACQRVEALKFQGW